MVKTDRFTFKLDAEERRRLELLAHRLQRTQSDAIRWLIRHVTAGLTIPLDWGDASPLTHMAEDGDMPEAQS